MQKEKAASDCEKDVQVSILDHKIATKWLPNIAIKESKLHITLIFYHTFTVPIHLLLFDQILELGLMAVSVLLKIKFGHAQISEPKIGMPMSKTVCISPYKFFKAVIV